MADDKITDGPKECRDCGAYTVNKLVCGICGSSLVPEPEKADGPRLLNHPALRVLRRAPGRGD